MLLNSLNDIWNSVLDSLGEGLTATSRSTWFGDCTPVELVNNRLVVHTPTDFKRDIILDRYAPRLEEALKDLFSSTGGALGRRAGKLSDRDPHGRYAARGGRLHL